MFDGIDPAGQQFLAALDLLQRRAANAQEQISSGFKISGPADAPQQLGEILQINSNLQEFQQISLNLGRVKAEVDTAESSLQSAVGILQRAVSIGQQGASTSNAAVTRPVLVEQLRQLHEQLVNLSRTTVENRFIFSGDADGSPAYEVNLANPNGVNRLITAPATRLVQSPAGSSFGIQRTAQDIFDHRNPDDSPATDNVFAAVNNLRAALAANDQAGIDAGLTKVRVASDYLNQQLAFYGTAQNRVAAAIDSADNLQTRWRVRLSDLRDTDVPAAIVELNQIQNNEQAALSAEARRPRISLFDYLK